MGSDRHQVRDTGSWILFSLKKYRGLSDIKVVPESGACTETFLYACTGKIERAETNSHRICFARLEERQSEQAQNPGHPGGTAESQRYHCHLDPALTGQGGALEGRPGSECKYAGGSMKSIGAFHRHRNRFYSDPIRMPKQSSRQTESS